MTKFRVWLIFSVALTWLALFSLQASDPDLPYGDTLTFSVDETLPPGASLNAQTGFFLWVVSPTQAPGIYQFTMRVTDSGGLSATRKAKITVLTRLYLPLVMR